MTISCKWKNRKDWATEYENGGHTSEEDEDGNESECGDATFPLEKNFLSADESTSQYTDLRLYVHEPVKKIQLLLWIAPNHIITVFSFLLTRGRECKEL